LIQEEEEAEDERNSIKIINMNKDGRVYNKNITLVRLDPKKSLEDDDAGAADIEGDDFNIKPTETTQKTPEK